MHMFIFTRNIVKNDNTCKRDLVINDGRQKRLIVEGRANFHILQRY